MSESEFRDDEPQDAPQESSGKNRPAPETLHNPDMTFKRTSKDVKGNMVRARFANLDFKGVTKREATKVTKLNEKLINRICTELAKGHYPKTACRISGISYGRFEDYMVKGARDHDHIQNLEEQGVEIRPSDITIHHLLYMSVQKALHMAEDRDLASIDFAAQVGIWQAAAWKLERRHSERWEKKMKMTSESTVDVRGHVQHIIITPDQAPNLDQWKKEREQRLENARNGTVIDAAPIQIPDGSSKSIPVGLDEIIS